MKQHLLMITSKRSSWNIYKQICLYCKYNCNIFEMINEMLLGKLITASANNFYLQLNFKGLITNKHITKL